MNESGQDCRSRAICRHTLIRQHRSERYLVIKVVIRALYTVKPNERAVLTSFGRAVRHGEQMVSDEQLLSTINVFLQEKQPWTLAKQGEASRGELSSVLYAALGTVIFMNKRRGKVSADEKGGER